MTPTLGKMGSMSGADRWDAVVVGASFAGLAAARALRGAGRVLLIDRDPIGANQTSACATPLALLERLRVERSVEQVHTEGVLHLPRGREVRFPLPVPFATFDYERLCRLLFEQTDAEFVQCAARGLDPDGSVATANGSIGAPLLVDASGWRAVLAPAGRTHPRAHCSTGLELRLAGAAQGLHFWLGDPAIRDGYLWDFPAGEHRRVGILTYGDSGRLRSRLEGFAGPPPAPTRLHGGALPARLGRGVAGRVFKVGDAAGQCLPFTGEGIRPAIVFGDLAGRLGRRMLSGELSLAQALRRYAGEVRARRLEYASLELAQWGVGRLPSPVVLAFAWLLGASPLSGLAKRSYLGLAPSELVQPQPESLAAAGARSAR